MNLNTLYLFYAAVLGFSLFAVFLAAGRKGVLWIAIVSVFTPIDYVDRYFVDLPTLFRWIPFFLVVGLGVAAVFLVKIRTQLFPGRVIAVFLAVFIFSVISMLLNEGSVANLFIAHRGNIMIVAFVLVLSIARGMYSKDQIHRVLVYFALLSSLVAVFQRLVLVIAMNRSADMVTGLMSVDGVFLYFQLYAIAIVSAHWLRGSELLPIRSTSILLMLILALAVGNNKAWVFFFPMLATYMMFFAKDLPIKKNLVSFVAALLLVGAGGLVFSFAYDAKYSASNEEAFAEAVTDPQYISRYLFGGDLEHQKFAPSGQLLRGASIAFAYNLVRGDTEKLLTGFGPAATLKSNFPGAGGLIDESFPGYSVGRVPLSMFLAELGFIGLGLQILMLLLIFFLPYEALRETHPQTAIRKTLIAQTLFFYVYENLYFEPVFALLIAVTLFPDGKSNADKLIGEH